MKSFIWNSEMGIFLNTDPFPISDSVPIWLRTIVVYETIHMKLTFRGFWILKFKLVNPRWRTFIDNKDINMPRFGFFDFAYYNYHRKLTILNSGYRMTNDYCYLWKDFLQILKLVFSGLLFRKCSSKLKKKFTVNLGH